jgi:hypothetical protein
LEGDGGRGGKRAGEGERGGERAGGGGRGSEREEEREEATGGEREGEGGGGRDGEEEEGAGREMEAVSAADAEVAAMPQPRLLSPPLRPSSAEPTSASLTMEMPASRPRHDRKLQLRTPHSRLSTSGRGFELAKTEAQQR